MWLAFLAAAAIQLSAQARTAIAPVLDALAAEKAAQATLPPPKDDIEKLIRLGRLDQAGRRALNGVDFNRAPEAERKATRDAMAAALDEVDHANQAELLKMIPPEGWFATSKYGPQASQAAFHIIQHSNLENWKRFVPVIERFAIAGEARKDDYALMYDRMQINQGLPQRYGSQFHCVAGKYEPYPIEDEPNLDARRKSVGLNTFAEYRVPFERGIFPC